MLGESGSQSGGMAHVKEWILTKCREAPAVLTQQADITLALSRFQGVVVTPDNIPQFTIPPVRGDYSNQTESDFDMSVSSGGSPEESPKHCSLLPPSPKQIHIKSAPVSPSPTWSCKNGHESASSNDIDKYKDTNIDPHSIRAMGLAHFKTKTPYGFDTLKEAPHTRRKESLFFDEDDPNVSLNRFTSRSLQSCKINSILTDTSSLLSSHRRQMTTPVAPLGVLANPQCEYDTTSSNSTTPELKHKCIKHRSRRRSSFTGDSEDSSPDMSPLPIRRSSGSVLLNKKNISRLMNRLIKQEQLRRSCSLECSDTNLGEIKFSLQFVPEVRQLKVILLKADNLDLDDTNGNFYIKLYLSPGKIQKHRSSNIKNSKLINERFIFHNLDYNQIKRMTLHLRVVSKSGTLGKKEVGQSNVILANLNLIEENRMWQCLQPCSYNEQTLGQLQLSACFEASAQKLRLEVMQACVLKRGHLRGNPDTYITIELKQPGRPVWKDQSKVKRGTTTPVYKEEFIADISPKIEDLNLTTLTFTVFERARLRNDVVIGQVRLGFNATEQSECLHWNQVLQNPGKAFIEWHTLMQV